MTQWVIPDEIREDVVMAADQCGLTVEQWLNIVVRRNLDSKSAAEAEYRLARLAYGGDDAAA